MRIDLREIKTYVITTNPVRRAFVEKQLASVGMTAEYVEGVRAHPKIVGCGLSHIKVLRQPFSLKPFLVLEDDVAVTVDFRPVIDIFDLWPLAYLGVSTWGIEGEKTIVGIPNGTRATRFDDDWLQIHNMLSGHAILYRSSAGSIDERMLEKILAGIPFDIALAQLQKTWVTLTPNKPFFYQSAEVGGAEDATRNPLIPKESNHEVQVQ